LVVAPCSVPFQIATCDFAHYDGTLTQVLNPPAAPARTGSSARLEAAAFARVRAMHEQLGMRLNLQRR